MDISIIAGTSLSVVLRWETDPIIRKQITGISFATGAPRITIAGHGLKDGWRVAVAGVKGPTELNAEDPARIRSSDYNRATVVDDDTIELNGISAAGFKAWISGGFVQWSTPMSMAGFTGVIRFERCHGGTLLASNLVADAPLDILDMAIDDTEKTITLSFSDTATTELSGKSGVIDVEMISGDDPPVITPILRGTLTIDKK